MSRRSERVASTIQQELGMMILRELSDPRLTGMPSITRVKVAEDMSTADVFVTIMGTEGAQLAALNALRHSAGLMRTRLTKILSMRITPYLNFQLDEELKKEIAILDLLRKVSEENAELDRKRLQSETPSESSSETPIETPRETPTESSSDSPDVKPL